MRINFRRFSLRFLNNQTTPYEEACAAFPILCCSFLPSFCTRKTVKGKVTDDAGVPLAGVNISVKGTRKGTQTDKEGNFSIAVAANAELLISYVGFKASTLNASSDNLAVVLQRDVSSNEEVVVVGYSTIKRRDLTGSVSSVGSKQLKDIPISSRS